MLLAQLPVQLCQCRFQHLPMAGIRCRRKLLNDSLTRHDQALPPVLLLNLLGRERGTMGLLGACLFLLLLDGFAFPAACHSVILDAKRENPPLF